MRHHGAEIDLRKRPPPFLGDGALDLKKFAARPSLQGLLFLAFSIDNPFFSPSWTGSPCAMATRPYAVVRSNRLLRLSFQNL